MKITIFACRGEIVFHDLKASEQGNFFNINLEGRISQGNNKFIHAQFIKNGKIYCFNVLIIIKL